MHYKQLQVLRFVMRQNKIELFHHELNIFLDWRLRQYFQLDPLYFVSNLYHLGTF